MGVSIAVGYGVVELIVSRNRKASIVENSSAPSILMSSPWSSVVSSLTTGVVGRRDKNLSLDTVSSLLAPVGNSKKAMIPSTLSEGDDEMERVVLLGY